MIGGDTKSGGEKVVSIRRKNIKILVAYAQQARFIQLCPRESICQAIRHAALAAYGELNPGS